LNPERSIGARNIAATANPSIKIIQGDSRYLNLKDELRSTPLENREIDGIFTSPPYVGQIDYHEQHIYAYELLGFERNDDLEIGPKKAGRSRKAREDYIEGISHVFRNVNQYLKDDSRIFIVANDRFRLYPQIAEESGMEIVEEFRRAVTKRTEQGDNLYQETIFYMRRRTE
jgi:DNA modification methylase